MLTGRAGAAGLATPDDINRLILTPRSWLLQSVELRHTA